MRHALNLPASLLLSALLTNGAIAKNQTPTFSPITINGKLPYQIELSVYDMGGATQVPTLHSFASATYLGEWILIAGRTNGLHDFSNDGFENFLPAYQNTNIWIINPVTKTTWSRSLNNPSSGLTIQQVDALSATNTESVQIGNKLYIAGGYVYDRTIDNFTTYDTLTALDLPGLVDWVKNGNGSLAQNMRQVRSPLVQVAGGEMRIGHDNRAVLIFGQDFEGPYSPASNGLYTKQVRAFDIVDDGNTLSITNPVSSTPLSEYRRRDLNVVSMLKRNNSGGYINGFIALSGVFLRSGGAWTVPVEVTANGKPSMANPDDAATFKQGMNTYRSATFGLYSNRTDSSHNILLGGISLETYNTSTQSIQYDPEIPFVNDISSLVRDSAGRYRQFYLGKYPVIPNPSNGGAPFLFGTEANFFKAGGVNTIANGMIDLDAIVGPTVIGYIFGGILAEQGNFGASGASNYIFSVQLTPVLSFTINGGRHHQTSLSHITLGGTASSAANYIEWRRQGDPTLNKKAVNSDGTWNVTLRDLNQGVNTFYFAVAGHGNKSPLKKVTITRQ